MADTTRLLAHVIGLKSSAARVIHSQALALARRLLHEYGRAQIYEWYQASLIGKVAFDVDGKASETTAGALLAHALAGVAAFFAPDPPPRTVISSSHGGEKLSYRIYCVGVRMVIGDVKRRIIRLELDSRSGGPFDPAIYSANQKLRTTGSIKTTEDARVLKLIDEQHRDVEPTLELLLDTLVQVVEEDWPLLEEPQEAAGTTRKRASENEPREPSRPSAKRGRGLTTSGPDTPEAPLEPVEPQQAQQAIIKVTKGRVPKVQSLPDAMRIALQAQGFVNIRAKHRTPGREGYNFVCDNRTAQNPCPCCANVHDNHNFVGYEHPDHYLVRSYSSRCTPKRFVKPPVEVEPIAVPPTGDALEAVAALNMTADINSLTLGMAQTHLHLEVVQGPRETCSACNQPHAGGDCYQVTELMKRSCFTLDRLGKDFSCAGRIIWHDATFSFHVDHLVAKVGKHNEPMLAKLFLRCHEDVLVSDEHGHQVRHFRAGRWTALSDNTFKAYVAEWLRNFIVKCLTLPAYNTSKELRQLHDQLQNQGTIGAVMVEVGGLLSMLPRRDFDTDPDLLGCDNCVIDMRTTPHTVRPQRVEDYLTMSTGYDFPMEDHSEAVAEVERVMAQIYPVDEERELVQRWAGYCLLGKSSERFFLALTDRRSGSNGKSTFMKALEKALGGYALRSKDSFLYSSKHVESINAHDAGWLMFKNKRLVTIEELKPKELDEARLKDLTGGNAHRDGVRAPHAITGQRMDFVAKIVVTFNEGKCPYFDTGDGALLRRMLIVQHRSSFGGASEEPYTFPQDPDVELRLTPHGILLWMLAGLERYRRVQFRELPPQLQSWKDDLVRERDDVAQWAEEHLESGNGRILRLKEAHDSYKSHGGKLGKIKFGPRLKQHLTAPFISATTRDGATLTNFWDGIGVCDIGL